MTNQIPLFALGCAGVAGAAGCLAARHLCAQPGSLPNRMWQAYVAWHQQRAEYLLDRFDIERLGRLHVVAVFLLTVTVWKVSEQRLAGLLALAGGSALPFWLQLRRTRWRRERLTEQVDSALLFLASALAVAQNLPRAIELLVAHFLPPMRAEFVQVQNRYRLGQTMEAALQSMAGRCQDPFITALVTALIMGQKTGGDIPAMLRRIAHSTRETVRVERDLRAKTRGQLAQLKTLLLTYPASLLGLKLVFPQLWVVLTNAPLGLCVLIGATLIVGVAGLWAYSILRPKDL